ncbi:hypothetical protein Tco_0549067 [Tanacetum coccineum]
MSAAANTTGSQKQRTKKKRRRKGIKLTSKTFVRNTTMTFYPLSWIKSVAIPDWTSQKGRRTREGSQNSSAGVSPVRYHISSRRPRVQDRLRYNDGNVFNRLSRRRRSIHERLSDTYSPSMTRSRPSRTSSRDPSRIRSCSSGRDCPRRRDHLRNIEGSYDGVYSSQGTKTKYRKNT